MTDDTLIQHGMRRVFDAADLFESRRVSAEVLRVSIEYNAKNLRALDHRFAEELLDYATLVAQASHRSDGREYVPVCDVIDRMRRWNRDYEPEIYELISEDDETEEMEMPRRMARSL